MGGVRPVGRARVACQEKRDEAASCDRGERELEVLRLLAAGGETERSRRSCGWPRYSQQARHPYLQQARRGQPHGRHCSSPHRTERHVPGQFVHLEATCPFRGLTDTGSDLRGQTFSARNNRLSRMWTFGWTAAGTWMPWWASRRVCARISTSSFSASKLRGWGRCCRGTGSSMSANRSETAELTKTRTRWSGVRITPALAGSASAVATSVRFRLYPRPA